MQVLGRASDNRGGSLQTLNGTPSARLILMFSAQAVWRVTASAATLAKPQRRHTGVIDG